MSAPCAPSALRPDLIVVLLGGGSIPGAGSCGGKGGGPFRPRDEGGGGRCDTLAVGLDFGKVETPGGWLFNPVGSGAADALGGGG